MKVKAIETKAVFSDVQTPLYSSMDSLFNFIHQESIPAIQLAI